MSNDSETTSETEIAIRDGEAERQGTWEKVTFTFANFWRLIFFSLSFTGVCNIFRIINIIYVSQSSPFQLHIIAFNMRHKA